MANALESASLVMIPSGYEDGTLGSLKPTDGSGDFTFSRGSDISATRVNADGYIEKGYENLLLQSNTFSDAAWGRVGVSVTGGQSGYDGTNDAFNISISAAFAQINQSISSSNIKSFSIYAKSDTLGGVSLRFIGGSNQFVNFNLNDGSLIGSNPSDIISRDITDVGNGWYRCTATTNISFSAVRVYPIEFDSSFPTTGSIYIQDAMLNQGLVAYPYIETTTAPVAGGILEDMPRLDYSNGSCPALLLEPQRTNLVAYSEYANTSYWSKSNSIVTDNAAISPEGSNNAFELTDNTSNGYHWIYQGNLGSVTEHRVSFFAKANTLSQVWSNGGGGSNNAGFDLLNGTIVKQGGTANPTIEDFGNGWYRCSYTSSFRGVLISTMKDGSQQYTGTGESLYIYGIQSEQDATYPTSYIPTYGVSQTRLDEATSILTLPETLTDNYTLFFDFKELNAVNGWIKFLNSSNSDVYSFYSYSGHYDVYNGSSFIVDASADPNGKIALRQSGSSVKIFVNGVDKTKAGATANLTDIAKFVFGYKSSNNTATLKQMLVFNTALSDDECIALTTI